nr:organellar oligopeptidase a, chloroplastic/mitochondrial [Quercus suber]
MDCEGKATVHSFLQCQLKGYINAAVDNVPWMIMLDVSIFDDVINNSENRNLHNELTRARLSFSFGGDHNNIPIIDQILKLRFDKAKPLEYKNYVEVSMEGKMGTLGEADQLMYEIRHAYHEVAVEGLFNLSKTLFGIDIKLVKDVAPFDTLKLNSSCNFIAYFSVDPYSQPPQKEDGAWTVGVFDRTAHLVYNLIPPMGNIPSLLTFEEVLTVFHEFGHALQRMLTKQDEGLVSGVQGIEWDAVELSSLFMEKWCYHKDTLMSIGKHYNTKKSIPESLFSLHQVRMGILDLQLHAMYIPDGPKTALDVSKSVYEITSVYPMLQQDRYLCSISHIFTVV